MREVAVEIEEAPAVDVEHVVARAALDMDRLWIALDHHARGPVRKDQPRARSCPSKSAQRQQIRPLYSSPPPFTTPSPDCSVIFSHYPI
jgi:hypothetical protein